MAAGHLPRQYLGVLVAATGGAGTDVLFSVLVGLHVLAVLAGFGSVGFAGFYGAKAARFRPSQPPEDTEELLRYFARPSRMWWAMVAVPFLGLGALAADPRGRGLLQFWVLGALFLWLLAVLIAGGMVVPSLAQVRAVLLGPGPPGAAGTARAVGDAGAAGTAGVAGVAGDAGDAGAAGPAGVAGVAGDAGTAHVAGVAGAAGAGSELKTVWAGGPKQASSAGEDGGEGLAANVASSDMYRLVHAGTLASRGAAACDLLFLLALALMIWQP